MGNVVLTISLFINILGLAAFVYGVYYKGGLAYLRLVLGSYISTGKLMSTNTANVGRLLEFSSFTSTNQDIVFLGDSITASGSWSEFFPDINARNRGIGGDKTITILDRLNDIVINHPKKIFLMVGANDLIRQFSDEEIIGNFERIMIRIKTESKNTRLYVESILPLNMGLIATVYEKRYKTAVKVSNGRISDLNKKIESLCLKYDAKYIDTHSKIVNANNEMDSDNTIDGLHLSFTGYQKLSEILSPYVYD